jgi:decaprenylphospho-beta-D-erythro-pentofuranosid-2-ulose 2-reductase
LPDGRPVGGTAGTGGVLVVGATSGIGGALCHHLAKDGSRLVLAGRDEGELRRLAADLEIRYGASVVVERFEALTFDTHAEFVGNCLARLDGRIDGAVVCHGYLPDPVASRSDVVEARRAIDVNFTSVVSLVTPIAGHMERQGAGWIAVVSSVAGDRGRQSNYVYGAAKGGLTVFAQGLRNRLAPAGVHVLTVKPGFVDTPMLRGVNPGSPLVASADRVASDIHRAIRRRRDVVYTPWFWRPIMAVVRAIPEPLFKRLKL